MKNRKRWIGYLAGTAAASVITLLTVYFEIDTYGKDTVLLIHFFSDGFFTSAVLYLGCGALIFISEAGGFYGLQYLGYTLLALFSSGRHRFDNRKDYFTYCTEKKVKQKEQGKTSVKWVLLFVGLGCLILSAVFALVFYQMTA